MPRVYVDSVRLVHSPCAEAAPRPVVVVGPRGALVDCPTMLVRVVYVGAVGVDLKNAYFKWLGFF